MKRKESWCEINMCVAYWIVVWNESTKLLVVKNCFWISERSRWYSCALLSSNRDVSCCCGVGFFGSRALTGWYISSVTKYRCDTDSEQVPWGKDEKDFEKRVKSMWNCWKGSNVTLIWLFFFVVLDSCSVECWFVPMLCGSVWSSECQVKKNFVYPQIKESNRVLRLK